MGPITVSAGYGQPLACAAILQSMPVGCHFRGCKAQLSKIVGGAISSELALPLPLQQQLQLLLVLLLLLLILLSLFVFLFFHKLLQDRQGPPMKNLRRLLEQGNFFTRWMPSPSCRPTNQCQSPTESTGYAQPVGDENVHRRGRDLHLHLHLLRSQVQ